MSVKIQLQQSGEYFDTPLDFSLEVSNTSPVFNTLGSKTVTTGLPRTKGNSRRLGYSERLDSAQKVRTKIPVVVSIGSYSRKGMLYQSSAYMTEKSYGVTIAFDEGIMYESMKDMLLTKLPNLPVIKKDSFDDMYNWINSLYKNQYPDADLSVFPVKLKKQTYTQDEKEHIIYDLLNDTVVAGRESELKIQTVTTVIKDSKPLEIPVPAGYGITPFVRVWKVLELIFDHFGYSIRQNPFKTHYQLKRLCVLNNTIDAIVAHTLDYSQLLAPVTIFDFLESLYCRFGMKVFFSSNHDAVDLILLKDILTGTETQNLKRISELDIDFAQPKQLKLLASKTLDKSETETETYEEFLDKYNHTIGDYPGWNGAVSVGGIYYDKANGLFYQMSTNNKEVKTISSIQFDWNKKDEGLEIEEITGKDECLTMDYGEPYFGLDACLKNSILTLDGESKSMNTDNVLAFIYDFGGKGSIFPWRSTGELLKDTDGNEYQYALTFIGKQGAFNQFFKEYDAFLRHSNHKVKHKARAYLHQLSDMDINTIYMMDNQPLLLDKIDYVLDHKTEAICEVTIEARTMRLYKPYDLDKEQHLPTYQDILYQWLPNDDRQSRIDKYREDIVKEYKAREIPFTFRLDSVSAGQILDDPNPPAKSTFWFLPPTQEQFISGAKTGSRKHDCKVRFECKYSIKVGGSMDSKWQQLSENRDVSFEYDSWYKPELK